MPLYLAEVWLNNPGPESAKEFAGMIGSAAKDASSIGAPQGVRIVAGPWASNEEAKAIFVVEIPDHTATFQVFSKNVLKGLVSKRRLTPVVEWSAVEELAAQL